MDALKLVVLIFNLIVCAGLVAIIAFQSGKASGLSGAFGGSSDTFLAKNKAKTLDARLTKATKWVAGLFILITVVLNLI